MTGMIATVQHNSVLHIPQCTGSTCSWTKHNVGALAYESFKHLTLSAYADLCEVMSTATH